MQDRPTAQELLKAAREFCENDLGPALTGRLRFHVRVLQNILGILEREWEGEEAAVRAEFARLQRLLEIGDAPEGFRALRERVRDANAELAKKIRSGELDDRTGEVLEALRGTVREKLEIANPNWF